jgi:hypothetical protein
MEIRCSDCGNSFERSISYRYRYMMMVTAVAFVIFALVVVLGLLTGTVATTPTVLSLYGVVFTGLFVVVFYALAQGEKRRNTLCPNCIEKAEKGDQKRKITWR